jgi:hypothetical protein
MRQHALEGRVFPAKWADLMNYSPVDSTPSPLVQVDLAELLREQRGERTLKWGKGRTKVR